MWTITLHWKYVLDITRRSHHILFNQKLHLHVSALNWFENSADCLQFGFVAMEVSAMTGNPGTLALRTGVLRTGRGGRIPNTTKTVDTKWNGLLREFIFYIHRTKISNSM